MHMHTAGLGVLLSSTGSTVTARAKNLQLTFEAVCQVSSKASKGLCGGERANISRWWKDQRLANIWGSKCQKCKLTPMPARKQKKASKCKDAVIPAIFVCKLILHVELCSAVELLIYTTLLQLLKVPYYTCFAFHYTHLYLIYFSSWTHHGPRKQHI